MPVIPATWEAEIKRIVVSRKPRQKSSQDPSLNREKLGVVVHTCHPSYDGKYKIELSQL
jgi:hypothetical protein